MGTDDRSKLLCALLPSQRGHRWQGQASLYPSSAAAWAQGTGSSFSVPFSRLNVGTGDRIKLLCTHSSASTWIVYGYEKLVSLLIPTLWKACGYEKLVLLLIPTLWKVCGYEKLVSLLIPTLRKVWGYGKLILLQIPKLWKTEGITRELYISKRRTPGACGAMSKMFVGGCWYFLEKCWKTGGKRTRCPRQPIVDMDVDCRRPRHDENYSSLFVENSHPETLHRDMCIACSGSSWILWQPYVTSHALNS